MLRHTTTALLTPLAAAVAAALVGGCGASASQPPAALPAANGAQDQTGASASASTAVAGRIPADYKVDIEINPTGDATQDALMNQTRAMLMAYEQAVSRDDPDDALYRTLTSGAARVNLHTMIGAFAQAGERPTGSVRFYRFTAKATGPVQDVLFCEDTSKVVPVDSKTGKKTGAVANGTAAVSSWDTGFEKGSGGTWTIVYVSAQVGRQTCM